MKKTKKETKKLKLFYCSKCGKTIRRKYLFPIIIAERTEVKYKFLGKSRKTSVDWHFGIVCKKCFKKLIK